MANERPTASLNELLEKKQLEQKRAENWLPLKVAAGAAATAWAAMRYNGHRIGTILNKAIFEQARKRGVPPEDLHGSGLDRSLAKEINQAANKALEEAGELAKASTQAPAIVLIGAAVGAGAVGLWHALQAKQQAEEIEKIQAVKPNWVETVHDTKPQETLVRG